MFIFVHFFITYVLSITCYCILYILYICISLYLVKLWWFIENKRYILKKAIDQYIHDTIFQIWHNLCSELTSILAIQKQPTNRPQLNKSDRPPVNIWDIWKILKYLNINENRKYECRYNCVVSFLLIVAYLAFWTIKR